MRRKNKGKQQSEQDDCSQNQLSQPDNQAQQDKSNKKANSKGQSNQPTSVKKSDHSLKKWKPMGHIPIENRYTWQNKLGISKDQFLLAFQNPAKQNFMLSKYDLFCRKAFNPLPQMRCSKYFESLDKMRSQLKGEDLALVEEYEQQTGFECLPLDYFIQSFDKMQDKGMLEKVSFQSTMKMSDKFKAFVQTEGVFYTTNRLLYKQSEMTQSGTLRQRSRSRKGARRIQLDTIHDTRSSSEESDARATNTQNLHQYKAYKLPQAYYSNPNIRNANLSQLGPLKTDYSNGSDENIFKNGVANSLQLRKGNDALSAKWAASSAQSNSLFDRAAIHSELHVSIPSSASSRILLLSEPDTPSAAKLSQIPVIRNKDEDQIVIDMFSLKMLGLLMCRDRVETKEGMLADLIRQKDQEINIDSERLRRSIKLILYFSEVVPKQFHRQMLAEAPGSKFLSLNALGDMFSNKEAKEQDGIYRNSSKNSKNNDAESVDDRIENMQKAGFSQKKLQKFIFSEDAPEEWTQEYSDEVTFLFDKNFDTLYESDFLPYLFPEEQTSLDRKLFTKNLGDINLILDMHKMRQVFKSDLKEFRAKQDKMKKAIDFFTY